jgi:hypothetical protein
VLRNTLKQARTGKKHVNQQTIGRQVFGLTDKNMELS